jgi:hypothetical protein
MRRWAGMKRGELRNMIAKQVIKAQLARLRISTIIRILSLKMTPSSELFRCRVENFAAPGTASTSPSAPPQSARPPRPCHSCGAVHGPSAHLKRTKMLGGSLSELCRGRPALESRAGCPRHAIFQGGRKGSQTRDIAFGVPIQTRCEEVVREAKALSAFGRRLDPCLRRGDRPALVEAA